jgi:ferric-dicitrate binding protein FerR (iron transport regulator)
MISLPEHIEIILEKHLKGLQNSTEMKVLEEWRTEKEAHELLYKQLVKLWQESGAILEEPVYDTEKAWNKLDLALKQGKPVRNLMYYRILLAASLIGILFLAGRMLFGKKDVTILQASNTSNRQFTLPDGSVVLLRKGASVSFPKAFSNMERAVILTGEAYFDVQPDKDRPFRIQTSRATLEVLGTSFIINTTSRYDRLVVTTGKVSFINKEATAEQHIIAASQAAVLDEKGFNISAVKDSNYLSWQTGILNFDNTPINQVATELSDYYNLVIQPDSGLMQYTITAKFDKQPVEQVLEEIKLLTNISYRKQHDTILLFKP